MMYLLLSQMAQVLTAKIKCKIFRTKKITKRSYIKCQKHLTLRKKLPLLLFLLQHQLHLLEMEVDKDRLRTPIALSACSDFVLLPVKKNTKRELCHNRPLATVVGKGHLKQPEVMAVDKDHHQSRKSNRMRYESIA